MSLKLTLQNVCPVPIHGKQPGEVFRVDATETGYPADLLWRKRLADKAVQIVLPDDSPAASSSDESEAPSTSSKKQQKGKA